MYTLYWEKMSGAIAPQALLEELGVGYRAVRVDMAANEHKMEDYLVVCPTARVPALRTPEGEVIGESGAMMLLLGERHPGPGLVPRADDPDRAMFLFWLLHMASIGYPTFSRAWHPEQFTREPQAEASIKAVAEADLEHLFRRLDRTILGAPYFLARGFSALDIYLDMLTRWAPDRDALLSACPRIAALCAAVEARPAHARVMAEHSE